MWNILQKGIHSYTAVLKETKQWDNTNNLSDGQQPCCIEQGQHVDFQRCCADVRLLQWWRRGVKVCVWCLCESDRGGEQDFAQPPCPPQAVDDRIWQLRVEVERPKAQGPRYLHLPRVLLSDGFSAPEPDSGSLSAHEGACGRAVWIYHVHNRVNVCGGTMKAQRERLRIPGLTLEWVFWFSLVFPGSDDTRLFICSVSVAVAAMGTSESSSAALPQ